jgi:hypothetical protein
MIMAVKRKLMVSQLMSPIEEARAHGSNGEENTRKCDSEEGAATRMRTNELEESIRGSESPGQG